MHQRANVLRVNFFQVGCLEQSNKTRNFRKIIFVTLSFYSKIQEYVFTKEIVSQAP